MTAENSPLILWHRMIENRDLTALDGILADDVVFYTPVVNTPQRGKAVTTIYLEAAGGVLLDSTFRYVREVVGESDAVLEFEVEIEGISVNGVDMIKWGSDGLITEFKVMLRPLKAVNLIYSKMGEILRRSSS